MMNTVMPVDDIFLVAHGGQNLQAQWEKTQGSIAKMDHINALWVRSNTSWTFDHLTLTSCGFSPWRQIRQVAAELERRRAAMSEAKWGLLRLDVEIAQAREKLETESAPLSQRLLLIEIGEKEDRIAATLRKFEGAMKDVADLERNYDQLMAKLGGDICEERVNSAEQDAHLQRALAQSVRSVRYCGVIDPGNQEYLEQIGVNPSKILAVIKAYLSEEEGLGGDASSLHKFIEGLAAKVRTEAIEKAKL
jgi:hypothetical protein